MKNLMNSFIDLVFYFSQFLSNGQTKKWLVKTRTIADIYQYKI